MALTPTLLPPAGAPKATDKKGHQPAKKAPVVRDPFGN